MKRVINKFYFVFGIVSAVFGIAVLSGLLFHSPDIFIKLLGVESIICGLSLILSSLSYEGSTNSVDTPIDERSKEIRIKAKAKSFDVLVWVIIVFSWFFVPFIGTNGNAAMYVSVIFLGIAAVIMALYAALLIFYERKM